MATALTFDLKEFKASLAALNEKTRGSLIRKAATEMVKPIKAALKETVPKAKGDYGPGGTTRQSIGHRVKLYGGGRRAHAGVHGVDRAVVIVGPRTSWSKQVKKKYAFVPGPKGVRRFKSTRAKKIQPSRVAHLIEKQSHYTARAVAKSRAAALAAARRVFQAGWKQPARRGATR